VTPAITGEQGWRHAGGLLLVGGARLHFLVDLTYWRVADYERQWRAGVRRLVVGAPSSALVTAYRGPGDVAHLMWALWRDAGYVYVQREVVLPAELDSPFDPSAPYAHVGPHTHSTANGLPIAEWRIDLASLLAGALGIRWPGFP
jgi:hypothetical protein